MMNHNNNNNGQAYQVGRAKCDNGYLTEGPVRVADREEVLDALIRGLKVPGRLWLEQLPDGRLAMCFARYNHNPMARQRRRVICTLEHGWVRESAQRIQVYESIPKRLGTARVVDVLEREYTCAAEAIVVQA